MVSPQKTSRFFTGMVYETVEGDMAAIEQVCRALHKEPKGLKSLVDWSWD